MKSSVPKVSDFDYDLPEEKIAKYPPEERGTTRLLVLNRQSGEITHSKYAALTNYLSGGDLLVLNDTRVIKARLLARKVTGAKIELLLLEKHADPQQLVMYSGKLKAGHRLLIGEEEICVEEILGNGVARISSRVQLLELVEKHGSVPIPPYLKREPETTDEARYQTVFAREHGSVAAPTASLNFTEELKSALLKKGVKIVSLTLHVGLGTFLPIRAESFAEHKMHREYYRIPKETVAAIQETKAKGGRVIGLGTTVTRALEHTGKRILSEPPKAVAGEADIFIYPGGCQFQIIDGLLTNFHAPRSTVLMLTATFAGYDNLRLAYEEALREDYRFLSYGDSMLIL